MSREPGGPGVPRPLKPQVLAPLGTVFALLLPNGKLAALKFVDTHASEPWLQAMFRVLPWSGEAIPTLAMLEPVSDRSVPLFEVNDFLLETLATLPESDRAAHLFGINDFSIMRDGRKKLMSSLIETGVVLPTPSHLPVERIVHPYFSLDFVRQQIQDALASDTMADGARP